MRLQGSKSAAPECTSCAFLGGVGCIEIDGGERQAIIQRHSIMAMEETDEPVLSGGRSPSRSRSRLGPNKLERGNVSFSSEERPLFSRHIHPVGGVC